jgi:plasmid stabilization system protein ParE
VTAHPYRLVIRPEARAEVAEAAGWYDAREKGLGRDFLRALRAGTDVLRRNPFLYQVVFGDMRRALLRRFPYGVFYEIHGSDVVVLGCMHSARDPEEWQQRATLR